MITLNQIKNLDPGIRDMVVKLNDAGFNTTDSGDGVSILALLQRKEDLPDTSEEP